MSVFVRLLEYYSRLRYLLYPRSHGQSDCWRSKRTWVEFRLPVCFCSTGFPLASTRWLRSTFSSHWQLSYGQRCWLTSATSKKILLNFFGNPGIQTRGSWVWNQVRSPLCNAALPNFLYGCLSLGGSEHLRTCQTEIVPFRHTVID